MHELDPSKNWERLLNPVREAASAVVSGLMETEPPEDVDWSVDPDDPDSASDAAMKRGHDSAKDIYDDAFITIIKPLNATTYNRYADKANVEPITVMSYDMPMADDCFLSFIVLPKFVGLKQPIFIDFDADGKPENSGGWLERASVRKDYWPIVERIRKALAGYASKMRQKYNRAHQKSDFDYSEQVRVFTTMLMAVGEYPQVKRLLKKEYPDPNRSAMEPSQAWPMLATLLERGEVKKAKEIMRYARIRDFGVRFQKDGMWVTWPDWSDMAKFFDSKESAEKLFGGDAYQWFDSSHLDWKDVWDRLNDKSIEAIRALLVGMPWADEETGQTRYHTAQFVAYFGARDLKDMFEENEGDFEEITDAVGRAGMYAEESSLEAACVQGYESALESTLGASEAKWLEFPATGKDGKATTTHRLGFFFKYSAVHEWLNYSDNNSNSGRDCDTFQDLAFEGSERAQTRDDYSGQSNFDDDYFNERLQEELPEMDWPATDTSDPRQPELIPQDVELRVYNKAYPGGAVFRMTKEQAEAFAAKHPEQMSKEAWEAYEKQP